MASRIPSVDIGPEDVSFPIATMNPQTRVDQTPGLPQRVHKEYKGKVNVAPGNPVTYRVTVDRSFEIVDLWECGPLHQGIKVDQRTGEIYAHIKPKPYSLGAGRIQSRPVSLPDGTSTTEVDATLETVFHMRTGKLPVQCVHGHSQASWHGDLRHPGKKREYLLWRMRFLDPDRIYALTAHYKPIGLTVEWDQLDIDGVTASLRSLATHYESQTTQVTKQKRVAKSMAMAEFRLDALRQRFVRAKAGEAYEPILAFESRMRGKWERNGETDEPIEVIDDGAVLVDSRGVHLDRDVDVSLAKGPHTRYIGTMDKGQCKDEIGALVALTGAEPGVPRATEDARKRVQELRLLARSKKCI